MFVIRDMLIGYLDMVSRKMTIKEEKARLTCRKELGLAREADFKN